MTRIGLLSDTHGYLDSRVLEHFADVDEIWHAGDIGSIEVLQKLREFKPTRAVYGNMDSGDVRYSLSEFYRFRVEEVDVLMTHIGGYPGKYNPWLLPMFKKETPLLFVC
jgi:putative phosphoesterase